VNSLSNTAQDPPEAERRRVLLVEDEALVRMMIAESLRGNGWQVVEAGTAVEALGVLQSIDVDLVLTDVHMPGGMTGIDLAREIRRQGARLFVVVMSGLHVIDDDQAELIDGFVRKPVGDIAGVLRAIIEDARP
jgi:CheY-like chemotaxis protein